jgi:hypothetical protein
MKTLSASLLFLMLASPSSNLIAQSQPEKAPLSDADRAIVQDWMERNHPSDTRIEGDRLILPSDDRDNTCAFLRVYRMKRQTPGSDLTRPAGYTTCVSASRFTMKSSVIRSVDPESKQSAPAR